nr:hypothetical protein [Tanacetum cinerariifolium]
MSLLQEALDACAALTRRVEHLEYDKVAQALEITKLKRRVKKLEKGNRVKGRMIDDLDKDDDVALMDDKEEDKKEEEAKVVKDDQVQGRQAESQAKIYKIDMDHASKVLSMQEDEPSEVHEVVDVVTTAKLITEVVTTAIRVAAASTRRRKRVVIKDPEEESTTSSVIPTDTKSKDKGKGIMVEEPKPLKKKQQVEMDEEYARKLHAEINKDIDWDVAIEHVKKKSKEDPAVQRYQVMKKRPQTEAPARKNMIMYLKNVAGFRLDYFKGMSYDDIGQNFEANFNLNIEFLLKTKEQIEEEDNRAIKSINETPAQKAAKRRKLNEEVEDLKRHLEIVPDEDDDVYTEATPLARKNFNKEYLESLWSLVKERFSTSKPNKFSDDFLLTTLGAMFERPDGQAQVWKNQRTVHGQAKVKSWKLLESYGVHIITFTTTQLILLVERRYPLSRFTLDQMLNVVRLRVEEQSEMSLELLSISTNSSQNPPHIDERCYECGDALDGIFCQRCTCKSCGKGAHIGYNCPPKVPIISNPESGLHETSPCQPINQNFYNSSSSGFDQTQPPQFPVIHQPPHETSIEILQDQENLINYVQTFLRKFNRYSFFETPKVLLLAWDRVFEIKDAFGNKQYKPEDIQELFRKLLTDVQNIHEELAEYINTPGWNRPAFYNNGDDDDLDYTIAITPVLSTKEPDKSLSIPDTMCDVHLVNNPTPLEAKDHFKIVINSNDDYSSSDNDSLYYENIEYVEASPHDSELVSLEVAKIVIPEDKEIEDDNLCEKLLNANLLIANIEALKDNPTPSSEFLTKSSSTSPKYFLEETNTFENSLPEFESFCFDFEEISSGSTTTHSDISLPIYEAFSFYDDRIEEISSGSTTTHSDISLSKYDSFIFDHSNDQFPPTDRSDFTHKEFNDELAHIISPPEYDCFYFRNLPDPGEWISSLNFGIRENLSFTTCVNLPVEDDHSPLLAYVV